MAQYATLKAAITAYVKTNGAQGITGQGLQNILVGMVDILGKYFQNFGGLATPAGSFTAGDENVSFLAIEAGTYTNFGGVTLDGKSLHVLVYDGSWDDIDTGIATSLALAETLADYAKVNGNYPQLTAGRATNIDGKSAIEGTFLFRTTAGDADISNGVATIEAVKGNTVAWNQLINDSGVAASGSYNGINYTFADHIFTAVNGTASATSFSDNALGYARFSIISGHKYYLGKAFAPASASAYLQVFSTQLNNWSSTIGTGTAAIFTAPGDATDVLIRLRVASGTTVNNIKWYQIVIDLTLMFGAGNEPATVAAFESWLAANVGSKPYYPASSKLLPTKLLKYVSRGFNQWDEVREGGGIDTTTGQNATGANSLRSKNYIPAVPSSEYCGTWKGGVASMSFDVYYYDAAKNYIGTVSNSTTASSSKTFTTPANCYYVRFTLWGSGSGWGSNVPTFDICINLSWDGSRDGEYEPYVEYEYNLDVTKFYGKLNGEGDYVQVFANGMRKAGSVCDLLDLKNAEADVKVGSVDLGSRTWTKNNYQSQTYFVNLVSDAKLASINVVCPKYATHQISVSVDDNIFVGSSDLIVCDNTYASSTGAQFQTAMSGVYLFYELATPLHYTDLVYRDNGVDTPVEALNVIVNNWSTEEEIIAAPEASGDPNSCAATLDILYGIDAAEQLDTINQSGIFTTDLKANLEALLGVINSNCAEALGGTLSISENPTDKVYSFTFTPNA